MLICFCPRYDDGVCDKTCLNVCDMICDEAWLDVWLGFVLWWMLWCDDMYVRWMLEMQWLDVC